MKTFLAKTVTAAAVCTLIFVSSGSAGPSKMFARYGRHIESSDAGPFNGKAKQQQNALAKREQLQVASYPKYKLIDLTLNGQNSGTFGASVQLNDRGEVIAQSSIGIPDPNCINFDCTAWHGLVREPNGLVTDLGVLPGGVGSAPIWMSESGLISGVSGNGMIDPLTDFPQFRAVLWNKDRSILDLGTLGGNSSQGLSVNTRGNVVGVALNSIPENFDFATFINFVPAATQAHAFLWENGSMRDLGTLGGNDAAAWGINQRGQIVGLSYTNTTPNDAFGVPTIHPFLYENGTMRDLGSLGGTVAIPGSIGLGGGTRVLNSSGQVALPNP